MARRLVQDLRLQRHHRQGRHDVGDLPRVFVPNNAVYLTTVGYGTGALLGRGIKRVAGVYWLEELGLAQAVWVLDVENFGPFLVESDLDGNSLFERENAKIAPGLEQLYAGTRPATLRRYGETDDKTRGSDLRIQLSGVRGVDMTSIPSRATLRRRAAEEFKEFLVVAAYLFVCFAALINMKAAILHAQGVNFSPYSIAVVKALLCAKFMSLGNVLRLGRDFIITA